ncbi:MAG: spore coat U domain-containing protein [Bauldia sp.]
MRFRIVPAALAMLAAALLPGSGQAATATGSIAVSLTILSQCLVVGGTPMTFASTGVMTAALEATSLLTVLCTAGTSYNIGLNLAGTETTAIRQMSGTTVPANKVNYALYHEVGHSTFWGQSIGTDTTPATGNGLPQVYTVYGLVPVQTPAGADIYTESVAVTVTY